jgi:TetR/AcrR family transcriptional repressor of bet genes
MQYSCIETVEVGVPKQVDHDARRRLIADAVCRLVGAHGMEGVSLRHVAAEAGVSMGQVQHYFASKDEMLLFAFRTIGERVEQRMAAAVTGARGPRDFLRGMLVELLPVSDATRAEAPVLAAFLARAVVEPALADSFRDNGQAMTGFVAERISAAQQDGKATPGLDPTREAATLLAVTDGLMTQILTGHTTADEALTLLDYHLDRIFTEAS